MEDGVYNYVFSKAIRFCVDLLIVSGPGVVVGKRAHEPFLDKYAMPGGRVYFGETIDQAIQRIVKSEIMTSVSNIKLLALNEYPSEIFLANRHSIAAVYSCTADKLPVLSNTLHFKDLSSSDLIKESEILPQHLANIKQFYGS